ncbi:MAG: CcoQ/FixQ family Cbb3-type cytochrome c oxidase assembly chaperone [Chitinophagaceae bacterium]|nr:MAG: CcoQ/FixQ family Cbb3-type cytochrome c oxidase assembly chaperone [Chitinophagaceae bacterium]
MKFVNYLKEITGIDIYPLASFIIFGLFFLLMLIWVFSFKKQDLNRISRIPLD